ncbi:MAG: hypothetical protein JW896_02855 [Deltaproteobacteria bacterium]|nr:hypothetical protein [Deltaproteobacteria bacterium]
MNKASEKVLDLVKEGKISPEEGDQLLSAMDSSKGRFWQMLFHPFERLSSKTTVGIAFVVALCGLALSRWSIRFDGALDLHINIAPVVWRVAFIEQVVAWPLTAISLWGLAKVLHKQTRLSDFIGFVGAARLPLLLAAVSLVLVVQNPQFTQTYQSFTQFSFLLLVGVTLPWYCWFITLLFNAYKVASGIRGRRLIVSFIVGIFLAETISKIGLWITLW